MDALLGDNMTDEELKVKAELMMKHYHRNEYDRLVAMTELSKKLAKKVHDDCNILPSNHLYDLLYTCLETLAEEGEYVEPKVYYSELFKWLSSSPLAIFYCDEAIEEYAPKSLFDLLQKAQLLESDSILCICRSFLEDHTIDTLASTLPHSKEEVKA